MSSTVVSVGGNGKFPLQELSSKTGKQTRASKRGLFPAETCASSETCPAHGAGRDPAKGRGFEDG